MSEMIRNNLNKAEMVKATPALQPSLKPSKASKTAKSFAGVVAGAVVGIGVLAGALYGFLSEGTPSGSAREGAFSAAGGQLQFASVPLAEIDMELQKSGLDPATREKLSNNLKNPASGNRLVMITLSDFADVDGDSLQLSAPGYSTIVNLTNATTVVPMIVSKNPTTMSIIGINDGGGGITASVSSTFGTLPIPTMQVGQKIDMVIR